MVVIPAKPVLAKAGNEGGFYHTLTLTLSLSREGEGISVVRCCQAGGHCEGANAPAVISQHLGRYPREACPRESGERGSSGSEC
jgi:hypothetical protein